MVATRSGIYHNLKESKYTISNGEIVYYFSSEFYLNKFLKEYQDHRVIFFAKMAKIVVENPLNVDMLADISLYMTIEKRGFRVLLKGVEINFNDLYYYALRKMTESKSSKWKVIKSPMVNLAKSRKLRELNG